MNKLILCLLFLTGCHSSLLEGRQAPVRILVWGQSNALQEGSGESSKSVSLRNASPMSVSPCGVGWIELGSLIHARTGRSVEIVIVAQGNTSSYDWATNWRGYGLFDALKNTAASFPADYILCVQGETDSGTPATDYADNMRRVWGMLHEAQPKAQIYMARCSYGVTGGDPRGGQQQLFNEGLVKPGIDIDPLRREAGAIDNGLHFTAEGYKAQAREWMKVLNIIS